MKLFKQQAIDVCQDYGFATADGWTDQKLTKIMLKLTMLFGKGEFEPKQPWIEGVMKRLAEEGDLELVEDDEVLDESEEPSEGEQDDGFDWDDEEPKEKKASQEEGDPADCPLQGGERVIVHDPEENWKGIVKEPISDVRVLVKSKDRKEWEVAIEKIEVVKKIPASKPKKPKDDQDEEIEKLQRELKKLQGEDKPKKPKKFKGKKLNRQEMILKILKEQDDPIEIDELAEQAEAEYVDQGRTENLKASRSAARRIVKFGVLFGLIMQKGERVKWVESIG